MFLWGIDSSRRRERFNIDVLSIWLNNSRSRGSKLKIYLKMYCTKSSKDMSFIPLKQFILNLRIYGMIKIFVKVSHFVD